jgi:hypothetical protein
LLYLIISKIVIISTGYQRAGDGLFYSTFQIVGWVDIFTLIIHRKQAKPVYIFSAEAQLKPNWGIMG